MDDLQALIDALAYIGTGCLVLILVVWGAVIVLLLDEIRNGKDKTGRS